MIWANATSPGAMAPPSSVAMRPVGVARCTAARGTGVPAPDRLPIGKNTNACVDTASGRHRSSRDPVAAMNVVDCDVTGEVQGESVARGAGLRFGILPMQAAHRTR
ncbi:MAG: hypothetical protein U5O39_11725 [Gammaproteobacteria bacterium]|nr:hypothetical protein [Gammaproteobacteria bacterium]